MDSSHRQCGLDGPAYLLTGQGSGGSNSIDSGKLLAATGFASSENVLSLQTRVYNGRKSIQRRHYPMQTLSTK